MRGESSARHTDDATIAHMMKYSKHAFCVSRKHSSRSGLRCVQQRHDASAGGSTACMMRSVL